MHLEADQVSGLEPIAEDQTVEDIAVDIVHHSLDLVAILLKFKVKYEEMHQF